jgi:hypothetical protein
VTAGESLARIRAKIERAKHHIGDLQSQVRAFLDSKPYEVGAKRDPETSRVIYYVARVEQPRLDLAILTGEILYHLRSALDHLAFQLVNVGTSGHPPNPSGVYFPIAETAAKYEAGKMEKVQGATPAAIRAIDETKPYKGGNDLLWRLHHLNNVDKHRLLVTVGSHSAGVGLWGMMWPMVQQLRKPGTPDRKVMPMPEDNLFIDPADKLFALKVGDELFIDGPGAEVNKNLKFRFEVAFGEPETSEGEPIVETLTQMADLVDSVVVSFRPFLS